jgi:hypothetical protein
MPEELREQINKVKSWGQDPKIPSTIYHGGDCNNLNSLYRNFTILSPEEKLKYPSTGGGNFGLSTTIDKNIAKKYSSVFGCNFVLSIKVNPNAKFFFIDTKGGGIDQLLFSEDLEKLANDGYDAVMEIDDLAEKEIRILKPNNFKAAQIEL